jgi:hypothetical protein
VATPRRLDSTALMLFGDRRRTRPSAAARRRIWLAPGFTVALMVLISALMLAIVPLATNRIASVGPGCTSVLLTSRSPARSHDLARDGVAVDVTDRHGDRRDPTSRRFANDTRPPARACRRQESR